MVKDGVRNPFEQKNLVICSFQFGARHAEELMVIPWDFIVIDEAHWPRHVYRQDNRIVKALKRALANAPKVLLTATPLQRQARTLEARHDAAWRAYDAAAKEIEVQKDGLLN